MDSLDRIIDEHSQLRVDQDLLLLARARRAAWDGGRERKRLREERLVKAQPPMTSPALHVLHWNGEPFGAFYVKGHSVTDEEFMGLVSDYTGECPCLDGGDPILRRWARLIPRDADEYDMEFRMQDAPAPGAFPVTFMEHSL